MFKGMIVEDSPFFRKALKAVLKSEFPGMDIVEAGHGREALQIIRSHPPHLIFTDLCLLGIDGLELTRQVKRKHPDIVIIILTNHDMPEYREEAVRCGADYFLSKNSMGMIPTLLKSILVQNGFCTTGSSYF